MARSRGKTSDLPDKRAMPPSVVIDEPSTGARRHVIARARSATGRRQGQRSSDPHYFLDADGRQHFNFPQRVWLDPVVAMAYSKVPSTAVHTLAVNLLTLVLRERDYAAAIGVTSRRAVDLAPDFMRECLLEAPEQAWILPRATIRAWLDKRQRLSLIARPRRHARPLER